MTANRYALPAIGVAVAVVALGGSVPTARADTETCVTHAEFDRTSPGESPNDVAARFDVYGYYLGDNDDGTYRRGYRTCWAPGVRRAVVVYSYDSGLSVDWYIHDV